ncbi:MAG TPA: GNAT family N-acetyltransferase, partial [Flexilinea sp.]|nr:GNAT family N-acetyltransferase [Flexilinea sp.]
MKSNFSIRTASSADVKLILQFIRELADYEKMADQVTATEELLSEWLFEKRIATVLIGESEGMPVGFALYFYNFSTFLGKAGIYLEDLYIREEYRHRG